MNQPFIKSLSWHDAKLKDHKIRVNTKKIKGENKDKLRVGNLRVKKKNFKGEKGVRRC